MYIRCQEDHVVPNTKKKKKRRDESHMRALSATRHALVLLSRSARFVEVVTVSCSVHGRRMRSSCISPMLFFRPLQFLMQGDAVDRKKTDVINEVVIEINQNMDSLLAFMCLDVQWSLDITNFNTTKFSI